MRPVSISINDFDYPLPAERIAAHPLAERDQCKLLVIDRSGPVTDHIFAELPSLLPADALLVYNNTRVINARMRFAKPSGAAIEIFCLEPHLPADYAENFAACGRCQWMCLVGNSKRWKDGDLSMAIEVDGRSVTLTARRVEKLGSASIVQFDWDAPEVPFASIIEVAGVIPVPPYLNRDTEESDSADYQTVYSRISGSVAAPTAGLHFTDRVLANIDARGIPRRELTLHVGAGTFQPVKDDDVAAHEMHSEFIAVPRSLIAELAATTRSVVAVGTTSVRTLESLYHLGCMASMGNDPTLLPQWFPYSADHPGLSVEQAMQALLDRLDSEGSDTFVASTRLMIAPGYRFRIVRGMVTNFHQPRSTLLLLVSAFLQQREDAPTWREIYDYALAGDYRFLSYGDACLFL